MLKNRRSVDGSAPRPPLVFGNWGSAADLVFVTPLYCCKLFKLTVIALNRFIVEKNQNAPIFHFKLCSFCWWSAQKSHLPMAAGYPSYTTGKRCRLLLRICV